jgi:uncharacterized protein
VPRLAQRAIAVSDLLLGAFALMLVFEGLMPLLSPRSWRSVFERAVQMSDGQIRFIGMVSLLAGVLLLVFWL